MNAKQKKISSARASTEGNRDCLTWNTALHSTEKSSISVASCTNAPWKPQKKSNCNTMSGNVNMQVGVQLLQL